MKTTSTFVAIVLCTVAIFSANFSKAQCSAPGLKFANPVLASGTALQEGAEYKFPNVTTGINCFIKLKKLVGGAKLISMETPNQGYSDAWQPIIGGPGAPANNKSWIEWEIRFETTSGSNYTFPCLDLSAIDVDGDGGKISEFIESTDHDNYVTPVGSLLSLSLSNIVGLLAGTVEALGPVANRPSIDTTALDVRINFTYTNKQKIKLKLGAKVWNNGYNGGVATERLNCMYFRKITNTPFVLLPVKYAFFNGSLNDKSVSLNWGTESETKNSHFEVERSFDNVTFNNIALVFGNDNTKNYTYKDLSATTQGKSVVYYRLRQVDVDGKATLSTVVMVRLSSAVTTSPKIAVSPNPFNDKMSLQFEAVQAGNGEIRIVNLAGQTVATKQVIVSKGFNNLQIADLTRLTSGIYLARMVVNGVVIDQQKVVKN